jgi:hypothetical protein
MKTAFFGKWRWLTVPILAALLGASMPGQAAARATIWAAPPGEKLCEDYELRVDGQPVPVYACRVSAVPFNQVWPGYQRPIDQTELAGFAHWGMSSPVSVEVTAKQSFTNVLVRPSASGIRPAVNGRTLTFALLQAGQVTVELDGPHHALHLFADPPETGAPNRDSAGVRYFAPGVHHPGKIQLKSGETLYLAGGAVVYTAVEARGAAGVRILGRGIIDSSEYARGQGGGCIRLTDCSDVKVEGVILRDPDVWCLSAFGCRNIEVDNVKLIGLWRYNADGIDICNSQEVVIRNSFVRSFDDAIVLKGLNSGGGGFQERPVRNVRVQNLVLWCDWGRALEIGAETSAPEIGDVRFQDCDIIRTTHISLDIQCGDRALVHDIRYENIRVETDEVCPAPRMQGSANERYVQDRHAQYVPDLLVIVIRKNAYSKDAERENVRDVTYADVSVTGERVPRSSFNGLDARHTVEGVWLDDLRLNGKPAMNATEANLTVGPHVNAVRFGKAAK